MSNKKYILHIGFPEDIRIQNFKNIYPANDIKTIINSTEQEIHIQAPLKLKTRRDLYKNLKRTTNNPILSILYPMTYPDFEDAYIDQNPSNTHIDTNEIKDYYSRMQPPVKTVDCDEMDLPENQESIYDALMDYVYEYPESDEHDSKHHKETISEHMVLVAQEIENYFDQTYNKNNKDYNILSESAMYHDLGKYWTKRYDKQKVQTNFNNHENVSAVIFMSELILWQKKCEQYIHDFQTNSDDIWYSDDFDDELIYYNEINPYFDEFVKAVTQIILNHMFIKNEHVSTKALKRRQLTDNEIDYLKIFTEADNKGRIV
jgi:hypothetical protein